MFPVDSKILLVDDSTSLRAMVKNQLLGMGYKKIFEAENGSVALEQVKGSLATGSSFNLILCDWNMPVMNGINFLVEIKADIKLRSIPVLIVTAESDVKQVVQAISAGASDYIVKPFDENILAEKMKAVWKRTGGKV